MEIEKSIVVLVGGVGGAKLALGLSKIVPPEFLTIIVNTGDDFVHYGLKICPDLDTVMYTLAGLVDPSRGWGVGGDTLTVLDTLKQYGEEPWFRLGDRDIATHLLRTHLLSTGLTLTQVTRHLTKALGIQAVILPMSDMAAPTVVDTVEYGKLSFQEYFVKRRWQPAVRALHYGNGELITIGKSVYERIKKADILLIGPSNPWLSIAPILAVSGMRELLISRDVPRVAVTPIIEGVAIKGPAAKIMRELGYDVSAKEVAKYYGEIINGFVCDERDRAFFVKDAQTVAFNTIMNTEFDRINLARKILSWIKGWQK